MFFYELWLPQITAIIRLKEMHKGAQRKKEIDN